jgi:hypothetical protein
MSQTLFTLFVVSLAYIVVSPLSAEVMNSMNYSLESDSINFGGGFSTSTNFVQESTFGETGTGYATSSNFLLQAGYQQMDSVFISLGAVADVTLLPAIPTAGGGVANGSTTIEVITDNSAGYELFIQASSSPALVSPLDSFADYTPLGMNPDFVFSVPAADAEFGFSPEGVDVADQFLDDGVNCNVGASDTVDACWAPLETTDVLIAESSSANYPAGAETVLKFRAESGVSNVRTSGIYTATSTVTALPL